MYLASLFSSLQTGQPGWTRDLLLQKAKSPAGNIKMRSWMSGLIKETVNKKV